MKKLITLIAMVLMTISANAQDETQLGYYHPYAGFIAMTPDESYNYKYVQACDEESLRSLNNLLEGKWMTDDQSIIRVNENRYYVHNGYSLPEGNYYTSDIYKLDDQSAERTVFVLPRIIIFLNEGFKIDDILEHLDDHVTLETNADDRYTLYCQMTTSEEVMEAVQILNNLYLSENYGISCYLPHWLGVDDILSELPYPYNPGDVEDGMTLICEKNWEGEWYPVYDAPEGVWITTDEGLAIPISNLREPWSPFLTGIASNFSLQQGYDYVVRLTLRVPSDGTYHVGLGSLDGAWFQCEVPATASDDFQVIDVLCPDFTGNVWGDGIVLFGCGHVVGTTVVKMVQVYEINGSGARGDDTAIEVVKAEKADGILYNLAGQKVDASYKGVVIRNGRKFLQK